MLKSKRITTPKINNPQNFKSSNTLVTTRKPHYATKVDTAFNIIPGMHRPNANNVPNNLKQDDFNGPEFKARPLKHWRRQLVPTVSSSDNSTQKRMSKVYFMDTPGSAIYKKNQDTCNCIDNSYNNGNNSFEIAESFNKNEFKVGVKLQNDGQIDIPSFYLSAPIIEAIYNDIPGTAIITGIEYAAEPTVPEIVSVDPIVPYNESPIPDPEPTFDTNYHTYTGLFDTACVACNPESNVVKSGIVRVKRITVRHRNTWSPDVERMHSANQRPNSRMARTIRIQPTTFRSHFYIRTMIREDRKYTNPKIAPIPKYITIMRLIFRQIIFVTPFINQTIHSSQNKAQFLEVLAFKN
jgi:hypothetical protein